MLFLGTHALYFVLEDKVLHSFCVHRNMQWVLTSRASHHITAFIAAANGWFYVSADHHHHLLCTCVIQQAAVMQHAF